MRRILIALLFLPSVALGQPSISGTSGDFDDGGSVTISGTGFGTKSPAAPLVWDDFEGGSNGTSLGSPVTGSWWRAVNAEYSSSSPYRGSLCAETPRTPSTPAGAIAGDLSGPKDTIFLSCKIAISDVSVLTSANAKIIRLHPGSSDSYVCGTVGIRGSPNLDIGSNAGQSNFTAIINHAESCNEYIAGFNPYPGSDGEWIPFEGYLVLGDPGSSNGVASYHLDSLYRYDASALTYCASEMTCTGYYTGQLFCYYSSGVTLTSRVDDYYLDDTLARVMICDSATPNLATEREMQIPSAWSATSITIEVNTGTANNGETRYLYVYDSNDNYDTYQITIGEGGSPGGGAPAAPDTVYVEGALDQ